LLDFYKSGFIQLSDIHRIVDSGNPYKTASSMTTSGSSQVFDWKSNAIQQIGLYISTKYSSLQASFDEISNRMGKIDFE